MLSKGKNLFVKLGCHGCHLADGYSKEGKVGPRLLRVASKVDPSWLYRWIKNPKGYLPSTRMPEFGFNEKDLHGSYSIPILAMLQIKIISWAANL